MASSFVSIGCQGGGPKTKGVCNLKVPLDRALQKHMTASHCPALDEYALVLRVDGTLDKFGEAGLARLRFAKAKRYISADIQIPESVWQPMTRRELKAHLAKEVRAAIAACVSRVQREGYAVAIDRLMAEVESGVKEYLATDNDG